MFKLNKAALLVVASLGLAAASLKAEDAKSTVTLGYSGYLDSNYSFDTNAKNGVFDLNQFGLNISAADSANGIKGVASLVKSTLGGYEHITVDQLYTEKGFLDNSVDVKVGRIYTYLGYEVAPKVKNFNETYSLISSLEPTYHDGLQVTYTNGNLSLLGLVAQNQWDTNTKDYGAQLAYSSDKYNASLGYFLNPVTGDTYYSIWDSSPASTTELRDLINLVISAKPIDSVECGAEYYYETQIANNNGYLDWPSGISVYLSNSGGDPDRSKSPKMQGYSLYEA